MGVLRSAPCVACKRGDHPLKGCGFWQTQTEEGKAYVLAVRQKRGGRSRRQQRQRVAFLETERREMKERFDDAEHLETGRPDAVTLEKSLYRLIYHPTGAHDRPLITSRDLCSLLTTPHRGRQSSLRTNGQQHRPQTSRRTGSSPDAPSQYSSSIANRIDFIRWPPWREHGRWLPPRRLARHPKRQPSTATFGRNNQPLFQQLFTVISHK